MKPRALAVWSSAGLLLSLATPNPIYRAIIAMIALNLLLAQRRPDARLRPLAVGLGSALMIALAVNTVISHSGAHVLVHVPSGIPVIGGPLTLEALLYGAQAGLGIVAACLCVAPLVLVVEPGELAGALPAVLARTAGAIAGSLELLPRLHRSAIAIAEAQRMRGWQPRGVRSWSEVVVPVVVAAVEESVERAEALEARGYGSGPTTSWAVRRWRRSDAVVTVAAIAALGLGLAEVLRGAVAEWYPLPAISVPPVDGLFVAACLLLAAPLVSWRR